MEKSQIKINHVYCYQTRDRKFYFTAMAIEEKGVRPYPFSCVSSDFTEAIETPKRVLPLDHIYPMVLVSERFNAYKVWFEDKLKFDEAGKVMNPDWFREKNDLVIEKTKTLLTGNSPVREDPELAKAKKELEEEMNKPIEKAAIETNHNPGKEMKRLMMLNKQGGDVRQYEFSFIVYAQLPPRMYNQVYQALQEIENFLNVNQLLQFKDPSDPNAKQQNLVYEINELPKHTVRPHDRVIIKNSQIDELLGGFIAKFNTRIIEDKELDQKFMETDETPEQVPTIGFKYDLDEDNLDKYCIFSFTAKCDKTISGGELHVVAGGNEFQCLHSPLIDSMMTGHKFIGKIGTKDSELRVFRNIQEGETADDYLSLSIDNTELSVMTEAQFNDFLEAEKKRQESI